MGNIIGSELFSTIISSLFGAAVTILISLSKKIYEYIKTRNVRRFWMPFIKNKLSIIITEYEYPKQENNISSNIAVTAGAGYQISKGMALALAHLLDFCESRVTKRKEIGVIGDKSGKLETSNMIILGSPANNPHSKSNYEHLSKMYNIPYQIIWGADGTPIEILTASGEKFSPNPNKDIGHDYALIIKADYQKIPRKSVLIIAGCYMWGTKAAAEAVTDPKILNVVANQTKNSPNVAFIIKTRIINDSPLGPEIETENQQYIHDLQRNINPVKNPRRLTTMLPVTNSSE